MLKTTRMTMTVKRALPLLLALSLFFLLFPWSTPRAQAATVISIGAGDVWRYFKGWQAPPSNWNIVGFDASSWPTGPSGFGYGDGDDATNLSDMRYNYPTVYIRSAFTVPDPGVIKQLVLSVDYDDGFVAYLNGVEVARANVSGSPPAYNALANPPGGNHEASRGDTDPQAVAHYDISKFSYLLVPGTNVLALQGHNVKLESSDFSLIPTLIGSDSSTSSSSSSAGATDIFRVIVLPDTQNYSQYYPHIFTAQTKWIAGNASSLNIKFVAHEGDIVNVWDSDTQWRRADASMDILDNAGIPYSVVPGNADHAYHSTTGSSTYYNTYFGTSRFSGKSWYGGSYHGNNNNYQLLTINGEGYIFISVDWCPAWDEIDWAKSVLAKYPGRKAILTTHGYLNDSGGRTSIHKCGDATYIWDDLIKRHANLQIVLSGHIHTDDGEAYRVDQNSAGKRVHQMMANYQSYSNGGNGWLRILEFDLAQGKVHVKTYSPYLNQYATDSSSQFSFNYP